MAILIVEGDVLQIPRGLIVHGCNAQGVMNSGIAKQVKEQFPNAFDQYRKFYKCGLGSVNYALVGDSKFIANAITQEWYGREPRRYVSYDAIAHAFEDIDLWLKRIKNHTGVAMQVHFPAIGAGFGGGNLEIIKTIIDQTIPDEFTKVMHIV